MERQPEICTVTSTKDSHQIPKNQRSASETLRIPQNFQH